MPPPTIEPIGLEVARTGRTLSRAFDDELAAAGGSLPVWLILTRLKRGTHTMQRDLAAAVGIEGATLTHHLHRMEAAGYVTRRRTPTDRRSQVVELTAAGDALFGTLLGTVVGFDQRLRGDLADDELATLRGLLERLRANVSAVPASGDLSGR